MATTILTFIMGMICFTMAFTLPVLPWILIILTIGGVIKAIAKIFK